MIPEIKFNYLSSQPGAKRNCYFPCFFWFLCYFDYLIRPWTERRITVFVNSVHNIRLVHVLFHENRLARTSIQNGNPLNILPLRNSSALFFHACGWASSSSNDSTCRIYHYRRRSRNLLKRTIFQFSNSGLYPLDNFITISVSWFLCCCRKLWQNYFIYSI